MALPRRQTIDRRPDSQTVGALRPGVIGAMWRESGKQLRKPMAPAMLLHGESVHGAIQPSGRALDERATPELAPQAQDRLLERIGRLLIAQAEVAREVVQRCAVSIVEVSHHRRIVDEGTRVATAGHDGLQGRHTLQMREPGILPSRPGLDLRARDASSKTFRARSVGQTDLKRKWYTFVSPVRWY